MSTNRLIQFPGMSALYNALRRNFGLNFYKAGVLRIEAPIVMFGREIRKEHVDALMSLLGEPAQAQPVAQSAAVQETEAEAAEEPLRGDDDEGSLLFGGAADAGQKPGKKGR